MRPGSRASQIHSNARHRCLRLCHGPVFSSTPLISIFPAVYSLFDCSKYLHACPSGIFRKIPLGPTGNTPGLAVVRTNQVVSARLTTTRCQAVQTPFRLRVSIPSSSKLQNVVRAPPAAPGTWSPAARFAPDLLDGDAGGRRRCSPAISAAWAFSSTAPESAVKVRDPRALLLASGQYSK